MASMLLLLVILGDACVSSHNSGNSLLQGKLPDKVDFNFHVKPILSDRCFSCHGPDERSRKAGLRLDLEETAFASLSSGKGKVIHPNNPSKSEIIKRIKSADPDYHMPPPESNLNITNYEIALIEKWIDQGAQWKNHWSFIPPEKAKIPKNHTDIWTNMNEIDHFILKKANQENLVVKAETGKERLLRRVYMDLTGLPPSVGKIDEFLNNTSSDSYEKVVDRLLNSEAHAERLAMEWMDVARYADSHGLHADGWRNMYPWRDWVIKAFDKNMSYDVFIKKQIAGDMLSDASREDIIATAFNRNHMMTAEGGAIDEEWRLNYVFDRTETMGTALLGLTVGCAKCHDHKYDPLSQKEYYQLASFFNNIKELGMTGDDGNYGPVLFLADETTQQKIVDLKRNISAKAVEIKVNDKDLESIESYIISLKNAKLPKGQLAHLSFESKTKKFDKKRKADKTSFDGNKDYFTYGEGKLGKGKYGKGLVFEKDYSALRMNHVGQFEMTDEFSIGVWINSIQADSQKTQTIIGNSGEKNNFWRGWDIYLDEQNHLNARLISALSHNYLHIRSVAKIDIDVWTHVGLSYDGSATTKGLKLYINGTLADSKSEFNNLTKSILTIQGGVGVGNHLPDDRPLVAGVSGRLYTGEDGLFFGTLDDIKIFDTELSEFEMASAAGLEQTVDDEDKNLLAQKITGKKTRNEIKSLREQLLEIVAPVEEMMVMKELAEPKKMYVYHRGEYDKPTEEVFAATPTAVLAFPTGLPKNRLGLVEWIIDKKNPLTARVTVNRYWQMIFGKGLVSTPADFGTQGALPSHPELLDWLAVEFVDSAWDLRQLIKKMVMSATYRQSSICSDEERKKDFENNFLARGSSYRLSAEMIRDNALAASGLLKKKVGGESVRPYQPEGLWIEKGNFSTKLLRYKETKGDSLYRRSLYTVVRRTSPHPMMTIFDAPSREVCTVTRENTNTPLQALVLMNDPQFVEAAKVLSERMQLEGGNELEDQIIFAFRCSTGRIPKAEEQNLLKTLYEEQLKKYKHSPKEAIRLLGVGDYVINEQLDVAKSAALAMISNTILNHDDSYMKR